MSAIANPVGLDPLIAEAKQRARRRRLLLLVAAGVLAASAAGIELAGSGSSGSSGAVPWRPTKPNIGPAHPPLARPCTAAQLRASTSLGAVSGGMWSGEIGLVNRGSTACALVGRPQLSLAGRRAMKYGPNAGPPHPLFDPLAPSIGSLRALAPGRHVAVALWVSPAETGACASNSETLPVVLTAPGGGNIHLAPFHPSCYSGYSAQATRYMPVVPQGPRSSKLPLSARIVSTGPPFLNGYGRPLRDTHVAAQAGSWLSFTVVLTNRSKHAFRFGRRCPAYKEGADSGLDANASENQVYVLNCHAVGPIAPHASVRFAMRVYVSKNADDMTGLLWTLAPHSYNAPEALAWLHIP